jgi:phage baseplate assembly protein gpV
MAAPKLYGKYRAYVVDADDPENRGRVKVKCPMVMGQYASDWCEICLPNTESVTGDMFIPAVGESVWVEFEDGDPNYPIVSGGWYPVGEKPDTSAFGERVRKIGFGGSNIYMNSVGEMWIESDSYTTKITEELLFSLAVFGTDRSYIYHQIADSLASGTVDYDPVASL